MLLLLLLFVALLLVLLLLNLVLLLLFLSQLQGVFSVWSCLFGVYVQLRVPEVEDAASAAELLDQWCWSVGQLAAHLEESLPEELQDKAPS